jgi:hypothetical protein
MLIITLSIFNFDISAQLNSPAVKETVYVPAYSSIFHGDLKWEFNLTVTLSIHNTDMKNKIIINTIDYYNTAGKIIRSYIKDNMITLNPLETYTLCIKETDVTGGVGANFIVKWSSPLKSNRPVIETIMIGSRQQQGISFTSRGVAIDE